MNNHRIILIFIVLFFLCGSVFSLRGVKPEDESKYQGNEIICDGGKSITKNKVNDDYCDCNDGLDEPGTSACFNGKFYCRNEGFKSKVITSSWVDDGHCDCCDGSDEAQNRCPNICSKLADEFRAQSQGQRKLLESGLTIRQQYIKSANEERVLAEQQISELKAKIPELTERVTELEQIKIQAEDEYNAANEKNESEEINENSQESESGNENKVNSEDDEESNKEGWGSLLNSISGGISTILSSPFLSAKDKAIANWNTAKEELESLKSDLTKKENFMTLDFGPDNGYFGLYNLRLVISDTEYTYEFTGFDKIVQSKDGMTPTILGRWKEWDSKKSGTMIFDNGERCWGGPNRSVRLSTVCGEENKLKDVQEPNRCEYTMVLETPAACTQEALDELNKW